MLIQCLALISKLTLILYATEIEQNVFIFLLETSQQVEAKGKDQVEVLVVLLLPLNYHNFITQPPSSRSEAKMIFFLNRAQHNGQIQNSSTEEWHN